MKKAILWIVGIVIIVLIVVSVNSGNKKSEVSMVNKESIKIGVIGPFTGEAAEYGDAVKNGVMLAVEELNNNGGVNGQKIEAIYEDGKCTGKDSATAAQKLVNIDKVKVIVGGSCSGETFGAAPVTLQNKVILFSPVSSAAKISDMGKYVFRNHPNDNLAGEQLASYMASKYKKIAIISEETDYAQGIRKTFTDKIQQSGSNVVFDESYSSKTKDFRTIVTKLKSTNPDAIFLCSQLGSNAAQFAKQIRDLGINSQLFSAYLTGPELVKSGPAVEGMILIDVPGFSGNEIGQKVLRIYHDKFGKEPNYKFFVGTSYDATNILAQAIKVNGLDTDKISDYLHNLKDYEGSIGKYSLDSVKADVIGLGLIFRQIKNGETSEIQI